MQNVRLIASWSLISDYKRQRGGGEGESERLSSDLWLQGGGIKKGEWVDSVMSNGNKMQTATADLMDFR